MPTYVFNYENGNCKKITHTFQNRVKAENKKKCHHFARHENMLAK